MPHRRALRLEKIAVRVLFTSCCHAGSLSYAPHAPQLVGLNPAQGGFIVWPTLSACLLSVDVALVTCTYSLIQSSGLPYRADVLVIAKDMRKLRPREAQWLTQDNAIKAVEAGSQCRLLRARARAHHALLVSG